MENLYGNDYEQMKNDDASYVDDREIMVIIIMTI